MSDGQYLSNFANGLPLHPTGSNIVIAEWIAEGTAVGDKPELVAPLHMHNNEDEAWYIIEGTLGFQIGERILEATAGQAVVAPRGTPHTYWNPSSEQAKYLIIMTTNIQSLIDDIHNTSQRDHETMKELFRKYDSVLL